MKNPIRFITVRMNINLEVQPINGKFHIKFERDIINIIDVRIFSFSSTSMNVAITKVADLVSRHPENYFSKINIE